MGYPRPRRFPRSWLRSVNRTVRAAIVRRNDEATTEWRISRRKPLTRPKTRCSAIQEALSATQPERRAAPLAAQAHESEPEQAPPPAADLFNEAPQSDTWDSDGNLTRRAANDDRESLGQMLQAMHRRPARMPYIFAGVASFIWTAGVLATAYLFRGELQASVRGPRAAALPPGSASSAPSPCR